MAGAARRREDEAVCRSVVGGFGTDRCACRAPRAHLRLAATFEHLIHHLLVLQELLDGERVQIEHLVHVHAKVLEDGHRRRFGEVNGLVDELLARKERERLPKVVRVRHCDALEHALFATSSGSTPFADAFFEEEEEEGPRAPAAVSSTPRRSPRLLSSAVL